MPDQAPRYAFFTLTTLTVTSILSACGANLAQLNDGGKVQATPAAAAISSADQKGPGPGKVGAAGSQTAVADAGASPPTLAAPPINAVQSPAGNEQVLGFRDKTVILYSSNTGHQGEKVPTADLPVPMAIRANPVGGARVGIMTVYGLRWIARSDISVGRPTL